MSVGIEYDMVLLPPCHRHLADTQEQLDFYPILLAARDEITATTSWPAPHAQSTLPGWSMTQTLRKGPDEH
jgi:hypothetical protein